MNFKSTYLLALIPIAIVGGVMYYFSDLVLYIILAWVVSMIGAPLVDFLRKFVSKSFAAVITLVSFLLIFFVLGWIFIPSIISQARNLAAIDYDKIIDNLEEPIKDWNNWLVDKGLVEADPIEDTRLITEDITDSQKINTELISIDSLLRLEGDTSTTTNIALLLHVHNVENEEIDPIDPDEIQPGDDFVTRIRKQIKTTLSPSLIPSIFGSFVGFLGNSLIAILSIFFIAFFFLKEQGLFTKMIASAIPDKFEYQAMTAIDQSKNLLVRYFLGVFTQIIVITLLVWILLSFLGIQNALLIGFFAALMNVIPYIGPAFGAMFAIFITISSQVDVSFYDVLLPRIAKVLIAFGVVQLLDNFIFQPQIFGKSVKAHPLEIFIVVLIGAKIGGITGMVAAIPAYTVFRVIGKVFFSEFKIVQSITKSI